MWVDEPLNRRFAALRQCLGRRDRALRAFIPLNVAQLQLRDGEDLGFERPPFSPAVDFDAGVVFTYDCAGRCRWKQAKATKWTRQ
jgi:hypothetical protein